MEVPQTGLTARSLSDVQGHFIKPDITYISEDAEGVLATI